MTQRWICGLFLKICTKDIMHKYIVYNNNYLKPSIECSYTRTQAEKIVKESNQYLKIHEIEWINMEDSLIQEALDSYDELNKQKVKNKMIIGVKVGEKIRELGITRHELAEKINMSDSQVDDLLSGDLNLTIDDITTIEQTLGITILGIRI